MKRRKYLVLFSLFAMNLVDQSAPEVETDSGVISGKISADAPQPHPKWKGVFKATDGSSQCPQPRALGVFGTEDCLKMNVYVPTKAIKPLPVLVYVHGGAFLMGDGGKVVLGAEFLLKHDVILVTFNYRLGVLGFLCLGIEEAPGNAGIKDQIFALKWVKKNIAAFGGDPDNVTIFGHSSGAVSVSLLLASETTKGLFHKAIVQSGSAISNWAINLKPMELAKSVAKQLGYDSDNLLELYDYFKNMPYMQLVKVTGNIPISQQVVLNLLHLPCVEAEFPGVEPAITDLPYNLLVKSPKNISVIYGATDKEGLFLIAEETKESLENANYRYLFRNDLVFNSDEEAVRVSNKIKTFYFGTEDISMKTIMNLCDIYGHLYFEAPTILEAEILLNKLKVPIYNYYFTYSGGRNIVKGLTGYGNVKGACHADDIFYLFNGVVGLYPINNKDQLIIDWLTKMWTNLGKNPTPERDSDFPVKWEPSTKNKWNFLHIGDELKMGQLPNPDAFALWKEIYEKYRNVNATKS